eukprot:15462055-Alexandrium_andersonii.AAC.1
MLGVLSEQAGFCELVRDGFQLQGEIRAIVEPLGSVLLVAGAIRRAELAELGSELVLEDVLDGVRNDHEGVRELASAHAGPSPEAARDRLPGGGRASRRRTGRPRRGRRRDRNRRRGGPRGSRRGPSRPAPPESRGPA